MDDLTDLKIDRDNLEEELIKIPLLLTKYEALVSKARVHYAAVLEDCVATDIFRRTEARCLLNNAIAMLGALHYKHVILLKFIFDKEQKNG